MVSLFYTADKERKNKMSSETSNFIIQLDIRLKPKKLQKPGTKESHVGWTSSRDVPGSRGVVLFLVSDEMPSEEVAITAAENAYRTGGVREEMDWAGKYSPFLVRNKTLFFREGKFLIKGTLVLYLLFFTNCMKNIFHRFQLQFYYKNAQRQKYKYRLH